MLNIKYFFYFLSIILVFHQNLYADHFSDKKRKKLATTYVLDDKKFEKFLEDSFMSSPHPRKVFVGDEWEIIKSNSRIIIARNKKFPQYICKAVPLAKSQYKRYDDSNLSRLKQRSRILAELKRPYIRRCKLDELLVVPQKWIFVIPNTQFHVIVAEYLDIIRDREQNKSHLALIFTPNQVSAMYQLIDNVLLWDGHDRNLCVTTDMIKVAIVDTEDLIVRSGGVFSKIKNLFSRFHGREKFERAVN